MDGTKTNFFTELAKLLLTKNSMLINIQKTSEENLTISITQKVVVKGDSEDIDPIVIKGSVTEIDDEILAVLGKPAEKIAGLYVNTAAAEKSIEDVAKETAKPAKKKASTPAKPAKKSTPVKTKKKTVSAEQKAKNDAKRAEQAKAKEVRFESKDLNKQAEKLMKAKDFSQALVILRKAEALPFNNKSVNTNIKKCQKKIPALSINQATASVTPKAEKPVVVKEKKIDPAVLLKEGDALFADKKYVEAKIKYEDALRLDPKSKKIAEALRICTSWVNQMSKAGLLDEEKTEVKAEPEIVKVEKLSDAPFNTDKIYSTTSKSNESIPGTTLTEEEDIPLLFETEEDDENNIDLPL